ncbi:hypothetical protein VTK73DRAFT_3756 [Phialemonium thermophilum]|uniref:Uncharacterized protein n=1 Tax=Phialemonium thermophilum TaxID=223376 RepID=A0ABR3VF06_9PEZI
MASRSCVADNLAAMGCYPPYIHCAVSSQYPAENEMPRQHMAPINDYGSYQRLRFTQGAAVCATMTNTNDKTVLWRVRSSPFHLILQVEPLPSSLLPGCPTSLIHPPLSYATAETNHSSEANNHPCPSVSISRANAREFENGPHKCGRYRPTWNNAMETPRRDTKGHGKSDEEKRGS